MKPLFLSIFLCILCLATNAQVKVSTYVYNGDTTISTDFLALNSVTSGHTTKVTDNVVGVRIISRKKDTYWLFFYFIPSDIPAASVSISGKRYAYIRTVQDKYYRIPYSGKAYTYSTKAKAGFFIDITKYTAQLRHEMITDIRLETSVLYHSIELKNSNQKIIGNIVNALLAY